MSDSAYNANFITSVIKNNRNYFDYRCIDPNAEVMTSPWYPITDVCPCDTQLNNPSGRGYTSCPMGVQFDRPQTQISPVMSLRNVGGVYLGEPMTVSVPGSMFPGPSTTATVTPPQLDPRQLVRVGYSFRS